MYRIIVLVQHYPLFICSTIQIYNNPVSLMGNKGYLWFEKYPWNIFGKYEFLRYRQWDRIC